jgi:hypothetical protein
VDQIAGRNLGEHGTPCNGLAVKAPFWVRLQSWIVIAVALAVPFFTTRHGVLRPLLIDLAVVVLLAATHLLVRRRVAGKRREGRDLAGPE